MRDRIDLAVADRRHRRSRAADADERDILRGQARLGQHEIDHHIGGGTGRGDADLHALEIGRPLIGRRFGLADADGNAGETAQFQHRADILPLGLHADRVFISTRHHIDGTAHQGLQGFGPACEIIDFDIKARLLEIAFALGNRQRQIIEQSLAADADGQLGLFNGGFVE